MESRASEDRRREIRDSFAQLQKQLRITTWLMALLLVLTQVLLLAVWCRESADQMLEGHGKMSATDWYAATLVTITVSACVGVFLSMALDRRPDLGDLWWLLLGVAIGALVCWLS